MISRNQIESLSLGLGNLSLLKKLSAAGNKIRELPDLSKCASLKELRLNGNKIMSLDAVLLPPALQILDIGNNCLR